MNSLQFSILLLIHFINLVSERRGLLAGVLFVS